MALDTSTPRSRRAVLAAAAGAAAATLALGARPLPVRAAGDDTAVIHIGDTFADAQSQTTLANQANENIVLWVASNSDSGHGGGTAVVGYSDHGIGVQGQSPGGAGVRGVSTSSSGVYGSSTSGYGVLGTSDSYYGVRGFSNTQHGVAGSSTSGIGVEGTSSATNQPATVGHSFGNSTGVQGVSGGAPAAKAKTGVYGYAAQDNFSRGVTGESPAGIGVYGISSTGYGGYFGGRVYTTQFYELGEIGTPAAPLANRARLFVKDNGAGKTQLCVRFRTGAVKILAVES